MDAEEFFIDEWTKPVVLPDGTPTTGIPESKGVEVPLGYGIDAPQPAITLREAEAEALNEGDLLKVDGRDYYIKTFDPPDEGLAVVYLEDRS